MDRRELRRAARLPGSRSYTVDTLRELRMELGDAAPLALLIGADSLLGLPGWHEWRALFGLAHFVVADRRGNPLDAGLRLGDLSSPVIGGAEQIIRDD